MHLSGIIPSVVRTVKLQIIDVIGGLTMTSRFIAGLVGTSMLLGCSTSPAPEQVTGLRAMDIGNRIRCEAAYAIRDTVRGAVSRRAHNRPYDRQVEDLLRKSSTIRSIRWADLHPDTKRLIDYYLLAVVVSDFSLNITETNDVSANLGLTNPVTRGNIGFPLGGHLNRVRNTQTTFRLKDTWRTLLIEFDDQRCSGDRGRSNPVHPIAGEIGILDQITDFVNLNHFERLSSPTDGAANNAFTRLYRFTTSLSGNANPTITLETVGRAAQITSGGIRLEATREDIHQVTISVAVPPGGPTYYSTRSAATEAAFESAEESLEATKENQAIEALRRR